MATDDASLPDPFGPAHYSPAWGVIGVGLLLVVALWYVWLLLPARADRSDHDAPDTACVAPPEDCLAALDAVAEQHRRGELPAHVAHQRVSGLVRAFLDDRHGTDLSHRTLSALPGEAGDIRELVALTYPHAFGADAHDPAEAIRMAREVVARCS